MKFKITIAILLTVFALPLITGCSSVELSKKEYAMLQSLKKSKEQQSKKMMDAASTEEKKFLQENPDMPFEHNLILQGSKTLANKAIKRGDYKPISFSPSFDKNLEGQPIHTPPVILGLTCSKPIDLYETISRNYGCVPIPPLFIKLGVQYNLALYAAPNFPYKDICKIDHTFIDGLKAYSQKFDNDM